jgi:hypothetical protein
MFSMMLAAALIDVLDMEDEPDAKAVIEYCEDKLDFLAQVESALESPETEEAIKEYARGECRLVLAKIKAYVGE